jgi:hypothetical protein
MKRIALVAAAMLFAGVMACDGGDDGGGSTVDLGNDSTVASSLTPVEAEQKCELVQEKMEKVAESSDAKHATCLLSGVFAMAFGGDDPAVCQQTYDACMAQPLEQEDDGDDCKDAYKDLENCTATLGEIEACMNDSIAAQKQAFAEIKKLNCSSTEEEFDALDDVFEDEEIASCKIVEQKCPGMVGEDIEEGEGDVPAE